MDKKYISMQLLLLGFLENTKEEWVCKSINVKLKDSEIVVTQNTKGAIQTSNYRDINRALNYIGIILP